MMWGLRRFSSTCGGSAGVLTIGSWNLMEGWLEEKRQGTLNTKPSPSPPYPKVEGDFAATKVAPTEAPE